MRRILKEIILPVAGNINFLACVFLGILSGLFSFLFINGITRIISEIISGKYNTVNREYVLSFVLIVLLFVWIRKTLALKIIKLSQKIFWSLRKQVLELILKTNYSQISSKKSEIQTAIITDVNALTEASVNIINFFTALVMSISCLFYQASISLFLFSLTVCIAIAGMAVYYFNAKKNLRNFETVRKMETVFFEKYRGIIDGFKEINMEPKKGSYMYENIKSTARLMYKTNTIALTGLLNNSVTGQILFYILISSILLFFSVSSKVKSSDLVSFVFTLIYLLGSLETIMVLFPGLIKARVAFNHLMELKDDLERELISSSKPEAMINELKIRDFSSIAISDLKFSYDGVNGFSIGPVHLDISKGDVIFLYGGNGSGKTTLIYSVIGIYTPTVWNIKLNGIPVNNDTYASYRNIFSVVFSDFYLFNEIIGVDIIDYNEWHYYLELFELTGKVSLSERVLSTTNLSTGQRKRLALIAILLEKKPVLVLDEWAADQDPYFRKKFYTEIIPLLKQEGFTIICITHDDKYYNCADKLYRIDFGKLTLVSSGAFA
ncbi:cyclic peptide export ABC transporter [Mucilaginibacter angelicae]|uniref:Cyclic peptide export ABC transporter n=1 Tax=Mucilaginibacter angelicae TaxID=869718 RepID=A0ABV6LA93_9SPHI